MGGFSSSAAGCIGAKETWELVEARERPVWLFWVLVVVMAALCVGSAALGSARDGRAAKARRALRDGAQVVGEGDEHQAGER